MPHFRGRFYPLRFEVEMPILAEPFEQWTDLKNDLACYHLNSSILVSQPASFWVGKTLYLGGIRGYPSEDCFLKSLLTGFTKIW